MLKEKMNQCPITGLILPREFIDEKQALKKLIDDYIEKVTSDFSHIEGTYFITFHAKFDKFDPSQFNLDQPKITKKLPPFLSNTLVWYVNNRRGIRELLWMVPPKMKGEKLRVEFNKEGVAYLQAKGAMPS